jgi:hypothetical protein
MNERERFVFRFERPVDDFVTLRQFREDNDAKRHSRGD